MIDRAQEALSCGLLPKARQRTDFDENTSGRTRAVMHFDSLVKEVGMFVGREDLLEQMRDKLLSSDNSDRKRMLYLLGMGGVGKTQLALEYAQRNMYLQQRVLGEHGKQGNSKLGLSINLSEASSWQAE